MNEPLRRVGEILSLVKPLRIHSELVQRVGSHNDGGYVVLNDFTEGDFLLSMGVANDVNFELELSKSISGVHLYDDSIDAIPAIVPNNKFYKERIGANGCTSIADAIERIPTHFDLILKMDIEGSEWEALDRLEIEVLNKFRQVVVEFHWFENLVKDQEYSRILNVLSKLSTTHFVLNAHPNNCGDTLNIENIALPSVIEVTYLRRVDYTSLLYSKDEFDSVSRFNQPCSPDAPELYLPFIENHQQLNLESNSIGMYSRFVFDTLTQERDALMQERDALMQERDALTQERDALTQSTIWRITSPYRKARDWICRLKQIVKQ
jgi:hypothetical protein